MACVNYRGNVHAGIDTMETVVTAHAGKVAKMENAKLPENAHAFLDFMEIGVTIYVGMAV